MMACTRWHTDTETSTYSWRHNQQFFANQATLKPGSFSPPFKFPGLIEIVNIHIGRNFFFVHTRRSGIFWNKFGGDIFLFDCDTVFFFDKTSYSVVKSGNNVGEPFGPGGRPLALGFFRPPALAKNTVRPRCSTRTLRLTFVDTPASNPRLCLA